MQKLTFPRIATAPVAGTAPDPVQTRPVYFSGEGLRDTPVYARASLQATHVVRGPAIVEQLDATTVIFPGQEAVVDIYGNLLIHLLRS